MSDERKKLPQYTTPAGTAKFCHLTKPNDKFKAEGEYTVDFLLTPEAAKPVLDLINQGMAESMATAKLENPKKKTIKAADVPYKNDVDADENETGFIKIKFKAKASGVKKDKVTKWTFKPGLFDAKGKPLGKDVQIWGGTTMKLAYEISPYYTDKVGAGVSLRLKAAQIIDLKTGQGRDAAAYGFGEEEGYTGEEGEQAPGTSEADGGTDF